MILLAGSLQGPRRRSQPREIPPKTAKARLPGPLLKPLHHALHGEFVASHLQQENSKSGVSRPEKEQSATGKKTLAITCHLPACALELLVATRPAGRWWRRGSMGFPVYQTTTMLEKSGCTRAYHLEIRRHVFHCPKPWTLKKWDPVSGCVCQALLALPKPKAPSCKHVRGCRSPWSTSIFSGSLMLKGIFYPRSTVGSHL